MGNRHMNKPARLILHSLVVSIVFLVASSRAISRGQPRSMTNEDVIELVKLGVNDEAIVEMIAKRPTAFLLAAQDLQRLELSGVPETVIQAMLETRRAGTLRVVTEPPGANVIISRQHVGVTPYVGELAPGEYVVELQKSGYSTEEWSVTVVLGAQATLSTTMQPSDDAAVTGEAERGSPAKPVESAEKKSGSKKLLVFGGLGAAGAGAAVALARTKPTAVGRWHQTTAYRPNTSRGAWSLEDMEFFPNVTVVVHEYQSPYGSDSGTYTVSGKNIRIDFSSWKSREGSFDESNMNLSTVSSRPWSLHFARQGN